MRWSHQVHTLAVKLKMEKASIIDHDATEDNDVLQVMRPWNFVLLVNFLSTKKEY